MSNVDCTDIDYEVYCRAYCREMGTTYRPGIRSPGTEAGIAALKAHLEKQRKDRVAARKARKKQKEVRKTIEEKLEHGWGLNDEEEAYLLTLLKKNK